MSATEQAPPPILFPFPHVAADVPAPLRQRYQDLAAELAKVQASQERLSADKAAIKIAAIAPTLVKQINQLREQEIRLLQSALKIYWDLSAWWKEFAPFLFEVCDKTFAALEAKKTEIRNRLVQIGYMDAPPESGMIGRFFPGWIFAHPEVKAAEEKHTQAQSIAHGARDKYAGLALEIEARLQAIKDQLLQGAAAS
jgi:hypothetical protein